MPIQSAFKKYPVHEILPDLKQSFLTHNQIILQAPPGAGKSTIIPLALLDEPWLENKKIIILEPRRVAARSVALRMASLLGEDIGKCVGYHVKQDRAFSSETKILVVTEGILTRKLQHDPELNECALLLFDEFHERSLHSDLGLALALESQRFLREDLRIGVMSATLDQSALMTLLPDAKLLVSQGRSFEISHRYLKANEVVPTKETLVPFILTKVKEIIKENSGDILIFLPGVKEIKACEKLLQSTFINSQKIVITTLYGNLDKKEQERALLPSPTSKQKIVLATNIAQTSLTIEGVSVVIDSGLERISRFHAQSDMNHLVTQFISQDAAIQRAGRSGRLQDGICYPLWHENRILEKSHIPEILRSDLSGLLLELKAWGVEDIHELSWSDTPPQKALSHAYDTLQELEALDQNTRITNHGEQMSKIPLHPRLSHMMIKAKALNLVYEASLIAAILSEKDPISAKDGYDLILRVALLHEFNTAKTLSFNVERKIAQSLITVAKQFFTSIEKKQTFYKEHIDSEMIAVLVGFAYPMRIAKLRSDNKSYLLANQKGAKLYSDDLVLPEYLAVASLYKGDKEAVITLACSLSLAQIEKYYHTTCETVTRINVKSTLLETKEIDSLGALILREKSCPLDPTLDLSVIWCELIEQEGLDFFADNQSAMNLLARIEFVVFHDPESLFSQYTKAEFQSTIKEWLLPYLSDITSLDALKKVDLHSLLQAVIPYEEIANLNRLVPKKIVLPSGIEAKINYEDKTKAVLSAKLQALFSWQETHSYYF
jgi:ATP-dependent helicase HrpB